MRNRSSSKELRVTTAVESKPAAEVRVASQRGLISWSDPVEHSLQGGSKMCRRPNGTIRLSAVELAQQIKAGNLSAQEVVEAHIQRIEAVI